MRIRILKPMVGVVDGVSLGHLRPGLMYDLENSLARYLITVGSAEASTFKKAALVIPMDDPYVADLSVRMDDPRIAHLTGGITVNQSDSAVANDKPAKGRPRKRR